MGAVIQNGNFVGGLDAAVAAKIGTATLTTSASDLSGAVNELDAELGNETLPDTSKTVKGNINSLKQSLSQKQDEWIYVDSKTGTNQISLPSGWKELYALVFCNSCLIETYHLAQNYPDSTFRNVSLGNFGTSYAIGKISKDKIYMNNVNWAGTESVSSATLYVYAR